LQVSIESDSVAFTAGRQNTKPVW